MAFGTPPDRGDPFYGALPPISGSLSALTTATFTRPAITGYRQLTPADAALMNEIKAHGVQLGALVAKLRATEGLDQRWVSIGATELQQGLMALTRAVAQPTTF